MGIWRTQCAAANCRQLTIYIVDFQSRGTVMPNLRLINVQASSSAQSVPLEKEFQKVEDYKANFWR